MHTQTVIKLLQYEVNGEVEKAMTLLSDIYKMTWMYKSKDTIFPQIKVDKNFKKEIEEIYKYRNREYKIYNILEKNNTVMAEIVESYDDNGHTYVTPIAFVWTFDDEGKVLTGKHYCDPEISHNTISKSEMDKVFDKEPILKIHL